MMPQLQPIELTVKTCFNTECIRNKGLTCKEGLKHQTRSCNGYKSIYSQSLDKIQKQAPRRII